VTELREEFEAFYAREKDGCLRVLAVAVTDRDVAEDLAAEAFARAWARWPAVRRHAAPTAWVLRTVLNLNVSWWRRRRREQSLGPSHEPAVEAVDPHRYDQLLACVTALPRRQREVVALRYLSHLSTRQCADVLGIGEGTVTAHLHRAMTRLRRDLSPTPHSTEGP
jgi:RNA polymerase sigma-70 factor (ECF subfamily)